MEYVITKKTLKVGILGMLAGIIAAIGTLCIILTIPYLGDLTIKALTEVPNGIRYTFAIIYGAIGLYLLTFSIGTFRPQTQQVSSSKEEGA